MDKLREAATACHTLTDWWSEKAIRGFGIPKEDAAFIAEISPETALSLLSTIKELMEALENIAKDCEADYPPSHGAIKHAARSALSRAKSLMEQKP